jgi:hypothetical protein
MACIQTGPRIRAAQLSGGLGLLSIIALAACEDARLPDLTIPMGDRTTFGTDLRAEDPVLGITVTDPLQRLP